MSGPPNAMLIGAKDSVTPTVTLASLTWSGSGRKRSSREPHPTYQGDTKASLLIHHTQGSTIPHLGMLGSKQKTAFNCVCCKYVGQTTHTSRDLALQATSSGPLDDILSPRSPTRPDCTALLLLFYKPTSCALLVPSLGHLVATTSWNFLELSWEFL